jgi:hypothetical protein
MMLASAGPSGLDLFSDNVNPDLTVGGITSRRFAPALPGRYSSGC